jgi:hypothetical protein
MQMVKYNSRDDHGYKVISSILKKLVEEEIEGRGLLDSETVVTSCT